MNKIIFEIRQIVQETRKGWAGSGVSWRERATICNIDPDKFLALPNSDKMLSTLHSINPQGQIIFFNTIYRKYPFLRYKN